MKAVFDFFTKGHRPKPVLAWEWRVMSVLFAMVAIWDISAPGPYRFHSQPKPQGIASLPGVDLTWLSDDWARPTLIIAAAILAIPYVLGIALRFVLPLLFVIAILPRTLQNSQGWTEHSHQLIGLVLLAQSIVVWWHHFSKKDESNGKASLHSWLLFYSQGVIAGSYVIAATSKLMRSTGMWVWNSPYLAFDLEKSQLQDYYKYLKPELAGDHPWAAWCLENPMLARLIFGGAFFLELFALLALKSRLWAAIIGIGLISLHIGIYFIMSLEFKVSVLMALIFLVNVPFWTAWALAPQLRKPKLVT